jgi:hypothetical protein
MFDHLFRTVNLTKTDFIQLQTQLHDLYPSRSSKSYITQKVFTTKSDFLRLISFTDAATTAQFMKGEVSSSGNLAPQLVIDTSKDLSPPIPIDVMDDDALGDDDAVGADSVDAADNDTMDADAVNTSSMDLDANPDSCNPLYVADATFLSEGPDAVFPCTIRYMDLTVLKLDKLTRVPHMMLIRDEWRTMVDIFNEREKGTLGGAIFTGQSGIGKRRYRS